jgi:hypothetical protein
VLVTGAKIPKKVERTEGLNLKNVILRRVFTAKGYKQDRDRIKKAR